MKSTFLISINIFVTLDFLVSAMSRVILAKIEMNRENSFLNTKFKAELLLKLKTTK